MAIKFAFSDECGHYSPVRTEKQNKVHPFYIRSLFIIDGGDYKNLCQNFAVLKQDYGLPEKEIKWAHIWTLRTHHKKGTKPNEKDDCFFLKDIDHHKIIDFVENALMLLQNLEFSKTIFTITNNNSNAKFSEKDLFKMHITSLLQRVQYEVQANSEDLAVLFFDPLSENKSKLLREIYFDIQVNGDFVQNYTHVKDSLNLEFSHHSTGIQLADFLAGVMSGTLKGYERSVQIFNNAVRPMLRDYKNKILGAGICEVPTNTTERQKMREHFKKHCP
ncbi:DUF3800 domain-containing protein [uncultured Flavobacterium sp.]|uniref:DUF3800 domain-containing protein n=1 Tax=uncultured Flavobacterium sp. TaxID=165435 RepID=UPI0025943D0A|nr:DUF3800 domain-containing protein [uncultured Flavobacterium sp.]